MYNTRLRGSGFSRTRYNEEKMGAYYTDESHCQSLAGLFQFPEKEEVCVLEPSIGNGHAVARVTGTMYEPDDRIKIFGVELDRDVCRATRSEGYTEDCICADFTDGVKISNNVFSFVFCNPPYIQSETENGERLEMKFLKLITERYIRRDGILVWIVPYRVISDPKHFRYLFDRYERLALYRFREEEYRKFSQVVFVGRKKNTTIHTLEEVQEEGRAYAAEEDIPVLPETFEGTSLWKSIEVSSSPSDAVKLFAPKQFDPEEAITYLEGMKEGAEDYRRIMSSFLTVKPFEVNDLGKPPIPLKKDSLYLLATSGAGQGKAGEKGVDLHLQRGVAEVVEDKEYKPDPNDDKKEMLVVTTHTRVTMTLIETDGTITTIN